MFALKGILRKPHKSTCKNLSEIMFKSIHDWLLCHAWYKLEQGTREDSVISGFSTLGTREDSVISGFRTLGTREDSVISGFSTLWTREDAAVSAFSTLGTHYLKMTRTRESMTESQ